MVGNEYQDQYKHFNLKHVEIKDAEIAKRQEIEVNFKQHID